MPDSSDGPTVLRILLGSHLRRIREAKGISARQAAASRAEIPLASLIRRKWLPSRMRKTVGPSEESGTAGRPPHSRRHALRLKAHGIMHSPHGGTCIRPMISQMPNQGRFSGSEIMRWPAPAPRSRAGRCPPLARRSGFTVGPDVNCRPPK